MIACAAILCTLQGTDEGQVAGDSAQADPAESLACYKASRAELVRFLRTPAPEQWERVGSYTEIGPITLTAVASATSRAASATSRLEATCLCAARKLLFCG